MLRVDHGPIDVEDNYEERMATDKHLGECIKNTVRGYSSDTSAHLLDSADKNYTGYTRDNPYYSVVWSSDKVLIKSVIDRGLSFLRSRGEEEYTEDYLIGFLRVAEVCGSDTLLMCSEIVSAIFDVLSRYLMYDTISWSIAGALFNFSDYEYLKLQVSICTPIETPEASERGLKRLYYLKYGDV